LSVDAEHHAEQVSRVSIMLGTLSSEFVLVKIGDIAARGRQVATIFL